MACGKSEPHMDDEELFLAGKFHCFRGVGDDGLGARDKSKNPLLKIESQQGCFLWIEFHALSFRVFSITSRITLMPSSPPPSRGRVSSWQRPSESTSV